MVSPVYYGKSSVHVYNVILYLEIISWVPVYVIQHQSGGTYQVETHTASLGTQQKYN